LFIVAGVVMNMIAAFVLLYAVGVVEGENSRPTVVGSVEEGWGADDAGIRAGDRIVSLAGQKTDKWDQLQVQILKHKGESVEIVVERDGELTTFPEVRIQVGDEGLGYLGVRSTNEIDHRDIGFLGGFAFAGRETGNMVALIFEGIGLMFSRDVPLTGAQGVAGPVGIVQISAEVVESGLTSYLWFLALISVNFALLNMLPLLPLDGGHVVVSIVEGVRGRSISLRTFERISMFGLMLFALLFFVAMYNDVSRIFTGW
jgi:regulator of sigma E protease